jgi:UDP-2-acetamido-3-amino-2,3-dideoxy-glucuronate N-acetyltransferase
MPEPRTGKGVIIGKNVRFGKDVVVWNYVVIGSNTNIGDGTHIGSFCDIGKGVLIDENCNIQTHVTISNGCRIGKNVFIAPNVSLLNDKFPVTEPVTPPTIKDNAIIGGGAIILPNTVIGEDSVVAAGSTVTKNVAPRTVVMGTPAKPTMTREEYEAKRDVFRQNLRR